jgi:5-methylcytosine-specific restriction endonuclease McrA
MAGELVQHYDPARPKVRMWQICTVCLKPAPKWEMTCDHIEPVQRVHETDADLDELGFDKYFDDRVFCEESNLQRICKPCHSKKSAIENAERRRHKRSKK